MIIFHFVLYTAQVTVIIGIISGFIMMVVFIIITVTLVIIFTWWRRRSHKNTHSVKYPAVTTSDEIVELQQNESYMIMATNNDMDEYVVLTYNVGECDVISHMYYMTGLMLMSMFQSTKTLILLWCMSKMHMLLTAGKYHCSRMYAMVPPAKLMNLREMSECNINSLY